MKKHLYIGLIVLFTVLTFFNLIMAVRGDSSIGVLHLGVPPTLAVVCGELAFAGNSKKSGNK